MSPPAPGQPTYERSDRGAPGEQCSSLRHSLAHVVIVSPPLGVKLVERDMNNPFPRVNRPFLRVNSQHGEQLGETHFLIFCPIH